MEIAWRTLAISVASAVALGVALVARDGRAASSEFREQLGVGFVGRVTEIAGRTLHVGDTVVRTPASVPAMLRHEGLDPYEVGYQPFRVGDLLDVGGRLLRDGSVLAYTIEQSEFGDDVVDPVLTGIVDSVGDHTMTVGGRTFSLVLYDDHDEPDVLEWAEANFQAGGTNFSGMRDDERMDWAADVAAGDAVFVWYGAMPDGRLFAGDVVVVQSGAGTQLAGTVRGHDEELGDLDIDGVKVHVDDFTSIRVPRSDPAYVGDGYDEIVIDDVLPVVGAWARVDGVLRHGVVIANTLHLSGRPVAPEKRAAAPRRRGWIAMQGVVTSAGAGRIAVNDLGARVGRGGARAQRLLGRRVRVDGKLLDSGIVATAMRRRS